MKNTCLSNACEKQFLPEGPHAAYNHNGTNDANALVFGHSAGELFADDYVHVILWGWEMSDRGGSEGEG